MLHVKALCLYFTLYGTNIGKFHSLKLRFRYLETILMFIFIAIDNPLKSGYGWEDLRRLNITGNCAGQ